MRTVTPPASGPPAPRPTRPGGGVVRHPAVVTTAGGLNLVGIAALAAMISTGLLLLDLGFGAAWTGLPAILGMTVLFGLLIRSLFGRRSLLIRRKIGALFGVDAIIGIALLSMIVARTYIVSGQLGDHVPVDYQRAARIYSMVFLIVATLSGLSAAMPERLARLVLRLIQRPALMLAGSFAALIVVMTLLLTLPVSVERVADVHFVDSFFTITSAVCVTGLTVNDPGATYTFFGEVVILLSIQLGGMGIMTIAALALAFARDTALATQLRYAAMMDARTLSDLRTTVSSIVVGSLAVEAVGALLLYFQFDGDPRAAGGSAAWYAVFHAVSAFCNAGFALFMGNLTPFADDFGVQIVMMLLIVFGGIGFPVMRELLLQLKARIVRLVQRDVPPPNALSLPTRVVLMTTGILIVAGALVIAALEFDRTMSHLTIGERIVASLFASVNLRTSGFNSVDTGGMAAATLLFSCVLMFIGGSPGSTAGGIKTTTAATLFATMRAELTGRDAVLGRRTIAVDVVRKATAVAAISAMIVLGALLLLTLTEKHDFLRLLFETCSAFGTVGLSTGITPELSTPGKLVVILTMFVGRVGPLTIALAVAAAASRARYRYASENLPIG
jgi:trk system potassium uptake protein TrkH